LFYYFHVNLIMSKRAASAAEEELSSAEEEDYKRSRSRRRPRALTDVIHIPAPEAPSGLRFANIPEADHPQLRTIAELVAEHAYLDTSKAQSQMCEMAITKLATQKRSTSSSAQNIEMLEAQLKSVKQEEAAKVNPWASELFVKKYNALPRADFYFRSVTTRLSHDELMQALRQRQVELPLLKAEYEMSIMAEAGTFIINQSTGETRTYPSCAYGADCVTNQFAIEDPLGVGKFISMCLMYPEEMDALRKSGTRPVSIKPCILCCRKRTEDYILYMRAAVMSSESAQAAATAADANAASYKYDIDRRQVHQLYRNLMDCAGGYYREYMLIPHADECIVDPIARFTCSSLKLNRLPNGRRCVDQTLMMWRPAPMPDPHIAEKVSNFY
jgi:hypothetical protein